jgi:hypothetical protein
VLRWRLIALPALVLVLLAVKSSTYVNPREAIVEAARAPYVALAHQDAGALCSDFTPAASRQLARNVSRRPSCRARVAEAFAASAQFEPSLSILVKKSIVTQIKWHGKRASVLLAYRGADPASDLRLTLQEMGGRWRVVTQPRIALIKACFVHKQLSPHCPKRARVLLFSLETPELGRTGPPQQLVLVPPAVKNAGGSELREFNTGMKVVAQSGCLACHRIGQQGNAGPGLDLTHIGSTLSAEQIEHAILYPTVPMPSFKNLPDAKLEDVVAFLSQLRSGKS